MLDYIPYIVYFLLFCINLVYTRITGKSIDKEICMFKSLTLAEKAKQRESDLTAYTQSFSPLVKQYRYNEATGELEELPDMLDVDKLVESCKQCALDKLLEKYTPVDITDKVRADISTAEKDLGDVCASLDVIEEWREKLGYSDTASMATVLKGIEAYRDEQLRVQAELERRKLEEQTRVQNADRVAALESELATLREGGDQNAQTQKNS